MTVDNGKDLAVAAKEAEASGECLCLRCRYRWISRLTQGERPKSCPQCKNRSWDVLVGGAYGDPGSSTGSTIFTPGCVFRKDD